MTKKKESNIRKIHDLLETALKKLFKQDAYLLSNGASERSVSHKLAEYLQELFPDYNVDCEYNRHGIDKKYLQNINECRDSDSNLVLPDILIHIRGNDDNNLIVIEMKTSNESEKCDIKKLELFISQEGDYKYKYGFFIRFHELNQPEIKRFEDGKEV